jgi:YidC/Oxa1 family membrane protein insertase
MKNTKLILWLLIALVAFNFMQKSDPSEDNVFLSQSDIGISTKKTDYHRGKEIILTIQNNTETEVEIPIECNEEPLNVMNYYNGEWVQKTFQEEKGECTNTTQTIAAGESTTLSYKNWVYRVFGDVGRYRVEMDMNDATYISNEFTIEPRKTIGRLWMDGIYRPILNGLIYLIKVVPGHSLGLAIVFLTLFIRTLLLIPSQRAMKSQKKMQEVQAKIDDLKKKHKDNQEKIALETVALWKEHKVNPFGSCILMLIQFPILIGLYYVIREGLHPDKIELLYPSVIDGFSFSLMETQFLGMELLNINFIVLPLLVGGLQFIQMQLAFARAQKKKKNTPSNKPTKKKSDKAPDMQDQMKMANNMMKYFMPAMIAFFTASLPAGVGLYWGTSTTYGILQQLVVNRQTQSDNKASKPTVRVIEKKD